MTEEQVKAIAQQFLDEEVAAKEQRFGKPSEFRYRLHGVNAPRPERRNEWSVVFLITSGSGSPVDGPTIVLVNDESGEARFLD